jgi:short-subunit dehydrogenase
MKNLNGKVIALTGAGSGIGRCLAIQLAQQGSHLSLSDIDEELQKEKVERFDQIAGTSPEKAAKIIIKGILKNRKRQLVGFDAIVIDILSRFFPQKFSDAMGYLHERAARKWKANNTT